MTKNNSINASSTGLQVLNSSGVYLGRTVTGTSNQIAVTNGDGISGNPTLALTSTIQVSGISFDSGSNTLSNYSTGTFTPTLTNSTTPPTTITYSVQLGRYTRIGNRAICNVNVALTSYSGAAGATEIESLPFTTNILSLNSTSPVVFQNATTPGSSIWLVADWVSNTTHSVFRGFRSTLGQTTIAAANTTSSSIFTFSAIGEI